MEYLVWTGLFAPLAGFLILAAANRHVSRFTAGVVACGALFISLFCFTSALLLYTYNGLSPQLFTLYKWISFAGIDVDFSLRVDPLSLLMTLIITGVGFLIHVYANGYMDHDECYPRFFAFLNFFVFAMLLLVLASSVLLLFVGWEGVGLASYLLIGFWYQRPAAAKAATKAFVVNRVGDFGFLLGILLSLVLFGTVDIQEISQKATSEFPLGAPVIVLLTILFFIGAIGKSAQLPLHTWLADAMEGPTPVSALIHAATMVTAGVYLVVRMHPLYMHAPFTLHLVGAVGGATALFAALCAVGQTDLKRVLAYSTVSQLGLMFLACGVGAFFAAMFHLTTHAFVKGLLFLSAGNVVHMMHGTTEMSKMGGLSKIFTQTHWFFLIGALALSGVPPLAAFFSKDLILEQDHLAGFDTFFYIGLAASVLTAFYMTRAYILAFRGPLKEENKDLTEAPKVMLIPVAILGVLSVVGGFLGFCVNCTTPVLEGFLAEVGVTLAEAEDLSWAFLFTRETLISVAGAAIGIGLAVFIYTQFRDKLRGPLQFLKKAFYFDEIYHFIFVMPLRTLSSIVINFLEPFVFDKMLTSGYRGVNGIAGVLQKVQSGQIRSYVAWMVAGMALLIVYFVS